MSHRQTARAFFRNLPMRLAASLCDKGSSLRTTGFTLRAEYCIASMDATTAAQSLLFEAVACVSACARA